MYRRTGAALLITSLGLTACAGPPTIRGVLKDRYPGYDQVLPTATAALNDTNFDYRPGNILALALAAPRNPRSMAVSPITPSRLPQRAQVSHRLRACTIQNCAGGGGDYLRNLMD